LSKEPLECVGEKGSCHRAARGFLLWKTGENPAGSGGGFNHRGRRRGEGKRSRPRGGGVPDEREDLEESYGESEQHTSVQQDIRIISEGGEKGLTPRAERKRHSFAEGNLSCQMDGILEGNAYGNCIGSQEPTHANSSAGYIH